MTIRPVTSSLEEVEVNVLVSFFETVLISNDNGVLFRKQKNIQRLEVCQGSISTCHSVVDVQEASQLWLEPPDCEVREDHQWMFHHHAVRVYSDPSCGAQPRTL